MSESDKLRNDLVKELHLSSIASRADILEAVRRDRERANTASDALIRLQTVNRDNEKLEQERDAVRAQLEAAQKRIAELLDQQKAMETHWIDRLNEEKERFHEMVPLVVEAAARGASGGPKATKE